MAREYKKNPDFPSVTEVLGSVLRKYGLEIWFKKNSEEFCNVESKKGKEIGTDIHTAIQQYITTGQAKIESAYPQEVTNALNSFILFRKENPDILLSLAEISMTSAKYKFNGTADAPHPPYLCDWKSASCGDKDKPPIYSEAKAQVASYIHLWNENNPDKPIQTGYIIALAKDKVAYAIEKIESKEVNGYFNNVFLPCLKIYRFQKQSKKKGKNNDSLNANGRRKKTVEKETIAGGVEAN